MFCKSTRIQHNHLILSTIRGCRDCRKIKFPSNKNVLNPNLDEIDLLLLRVWDFEILIRNKRLVKPSYPNKYNIHSTHSIHFTRIQTLQLIKNMTPNFHNINATTNYNLDFKQTFVKRAQFAHYEATLDFDFFILEWRILKRVRSSIKEKNSRRLREAI